MSSYKQYKKHIFDKKRNGTYCQSMASYPEYAKHVDEVDCQHCLKLVNMIKKEIQDEKKKININLK